MGATVYLFDSEKNAEAYRDFWVDYEPETYENAMKVVGNRVYMAYEGGEEWYDLYVNTILKCEIPQSLSETRLDYMLDSVTHGAYVSITYMNVSTNFIDPYNSDATPESGESFDHHLSASEDDSATNKYVYCTAMEANDPNNERFGNLESKINKNGDEGSYVDKEREEGFVFFRYIEKQA